MEIQKTANQRLHSKRSLFFSIGLSIACLLTFVAFEYRVYLPDHTKVSLTEPDDVVFIAQNVRPTVQPDKPKPIQKPKKEVEYIITQKPDETKEKETEKPDLDSLNDLISTALTAGKPDDEAIEDNSVYIAGGLEYSPEFPGGIEEFYQYLGNAIEYPRYEQRAAIEGKVYVSFIIEKNGQLTDIKVIKGVSEGLDEEAIRVLKESPDWIPGSQRGRKVRVKMVIPIVFSLR